MSSHTANVDIWNDSRAWSTNNRTLRVPTLEDIEPCAALRTELMLAHRKIQALEQRNAKLQETVGISQNDSAKDGTGQ